MSILSIEGYQKENLILSKYFNETFAYMYDMFLEVQAEVGKRDINVSNHANIDRYEF